MTQIQRKVLQSFLLCLMMPQQKVALASTNATTSPIPSVSPTITAKPTLSHRPTTSPTHSASPTVSHAPTKSPQPSKSPLPSSPPSKSPQPSKSPLPSSPPTASPAPSIPPTSNNTISPQPSSSMSPAPSNPPSSSATPNNNNNNNSKHHVSIWKIIGKSIAWLIICALGVLSFGACFANRYRLYYYAKSAWYSFLRWEMTRKALRVLRVDRFFQSAYEETSLNEIIFDNNNNDMGYGLMMQDA